MSFYIAFFIAAVLLWFGLWVILIMIIDEKTPIPAAPSTLISLVASIVIVGGLFYCIWHGPPPYQPANTTPIQTLELNIAEMKWWYGDGIIITEEGKEETQILYIHDDIWRRVKHLRGPMIVNVQDKRILSMYPDGD